MSAPDLTCYDYIIGLYNGDCDCYNGRPSDYNVSNSGLYISDLLEPKMIDSLLNCDQGDSIWELMEIVRELAIRNFIADTNALLMKQARLIRVPYKGGLGRAIWTKNLSLTTGDWAGVRIKAADIRSGYLRIKKIGLIPSANCTPDLLIYNINGTLLNTIALTGVANTHTLTTVDLEYPLHDDYAQLEYFLIYQLDGSWQPKNNDLICPCEKNCPEWGYFSYYNQYKKHNWNQWIQAGGWKDNALPAFNSDSISYISNYMYGLTLQIELGCYVNELLCDEELDFDGNLLAQAMAVAIQKSAGALFVDKILRTTNLSRANMLDREGLQKAKEEWNASYQTMTQYIVDNIDFSANDCLECRDIIELIHGGIMA